MADKILSHCDFCGNPTRRPAVNGERLCQRCAREDVDRIAAYRRRYAARQRAIAEAADLARQHLPRKCRARIDRAERLALQHTLIIHDDGTAEVKSQNGNGHYTINERCNCPDAEKADGWIGAPLVAVNGHEVPACKHQIAVWLVIKAQNLEAV